MNEEDPLETRRNTDWALCCLCQVNSKELRSPHTKVCWQGAYRTLEDDLTHFDTEKVPLPLGLNLKCLDDGSGIASTLLKNKAAYHNGCRSLIRPLIVKRELQKRYKDNEDKEAPVSPKKTIKFQCHS